MAIKKFKFFLFLILSPIPRIEIKFNDFFDLNLVMDGVS